MDWVETLSQEKKKKKFSKERRQEVQTMKDNQTKVQVNKKGDSTGKDCRHSSKSIKNKDFNKKSRS